MDQNHDNTSVQWGRGERERFKERKRNFETEFMVNTKELLT